MVLLLEVDVIGKDGAFTDLLEKIGHVVSGGVPCFAHSLSVGVDVKGTDAAPFIEDAVEKGDESEFWNASEEILELEAIFALKLALGDCN